MSTWATFAESLKQTADAKVLPAAEIVKIASATAELAKARAQAMKTASVSKAVTAHEVANELFREAIHDLVEDPVTAQRLAPKTYGLGCKRQVIDRDFYVTFNRKNVTLVDLGETPLERVTATGITTTEADYPLDVLIYATGFDAMTGALLRAGIRGRGGRSLREKWADGPLNFLGLGMQGFPNLFTVTGPGSPSVLCNMLVAIEQHVNWIGECID